jgi:hypothetical protein
LTEAHLQELRGSVGWLKGLFLSQLFFSHAGLILKIPTLLFIVTTPLSLSHSMHTPFFTVTQLIIHSQLFIYGKLN